MVLDEVTDMKRMKEALMKAMKKCTGRKFMRENILYFPYSRISSVAVCCTHHPYRIFQSPFWKVPLWAAQTIP
jgi:hypothetical protein